MNIQLRLLILSAILVFSGVAVHGQAPVANFSANYTSSCNPLVVQFTDLSTNSPTSWSWNLGNSTTSTLQNPSTTYTTPGTYTVTLTVSNASGTNAKTITGYITILTSPVVSFAANDSTPGCGAKTVTFIDSSTLGSSGTGTYYWDFGDGSSSTAQNPTHTYTSVGAYSVSLTVTQLRRMFQAFSKNWLYPGFTKRNCRLYRCKCERLYRSFDYKLYQYFFRRHELYMVFRRW